MKCISTGNNTIQLVNIMNTRTICITAILLILVSQTIEAKPVIIGFNGNLDSETIDAYNITNYTSHQQINAISADIPESTIDKIKKNPRIRYVEDDAWVHTEKKVVQAPQQIDWGVYRVNAPGAWDSSTGSDVKIAVIDTGISKNHPDLNVNSGVNLIGKLHNKKWDDDNGHGTHVAGIIAACNNSIGVIGVAPDVELYAVKVLDSYGGGRISDVIEGIEWAVLNNMDIISMSLGTDAYSQALDDTCNNAYGSGILLVAATGNNGDGNLSTDDVMYPARFDSVIGVSAVDYDNIAPLWSADGCEVELAAPGVNIYSTWLDGGYATRSGTSMATPFVSGVAALMMQGNTGSSPGEIRAILTNNSIDLGAEGRDGFYGFGLVQASLVS